ncbi:MAG: RNA polymerase sigma factor [Planctomycetota bacterium]
MLRAKGGDQGAFGELVTAYRGRVYATALALTGDPTEAEELTQEAFVRAMKGLARLERPERFEGFMRGITTTLHKDVRRKAAREKRHLESAARQRPKDAEEPADAPLAAREQSARQHALLHDLVNGLPQNVRVALDLRFRRDLSYAEIAQEMGVPPSTVRGLLFRGTKALRQKLRPMLRRAGESA